MIDSQKSRKYAHFALTHGFGLLSLGVEDGELELGTHLGLRTADQQQVEGQVIFTLLVQALGIHPQTPDGDGGRINSAF